MFYLGIAFLGIYAFSRIGVDLLPNVNLPHLLVQTTYPNASPEEVEKLVPEPLESAVGTVTGVKKITSVSKEGLAVISVDFVWGTDMNMAMLAMREKLDNIRFALPREAGRPTIVKSDPSASPIMSLVLAYRGENLKLGSQEQRRKSKEIRTNERRTNEQRTNEQRTKNILEIHNQFVTHNSPYPEIKRLIDLKEAGRVIFRRRLEQLDGVAQAVVTGGLEREILVEVKPEKLIAYNISFDEIENALKSANINMPSGSIMKGLFRYSLRTKGEFRNIKDIKKTIIKRNNNGNVVYLSDIASIKENFKDRKGLTRLNGKETVGLLIFKEPDANTVTVARKVKETLITLRNEYPEYNLIVVTDQSRFIQNSIANVKQSIFYGGILAVIVLFFFLGSIRNILIISITIPASLVLTVLLMFLFKISFNIISLGGVAVGIGMLLDNAIIVLENVVRHKDKGLPLRRAALTGTEEVTMPIVASTLTTLAVFVPLLFIKGIAGELFEDQSYAIIFSLSASIIASITLIPMLAAREKISFLKDKEKFGKNYINIKYIKNKSIFYKISFWIKFPFIVTVKSIFVIFVKTSLFVSRMFSKIFNRFFVKVKLWLNFIMNIYERLLAWSLDNRKKVLLITIVLLLMAISAALEMKKEFIPPAPQSDFIVELDYPKGTSLEGNAVITSKIERAILSLIHVEDVVSNIGRVNEFDFLNKNQMDINKTNMIVKLDSYKNYYSVQKKLTGILQNLGRTKYAFKKVKSTYSELLNPTENDIAIKIRNKDLTAAYKTAGIFLNDVKKEKTEGISDLRLGVEKGTPEYIITINRDKCASHGVDISDVAGQIVYLVKGKKAASFSDFDKKISVILKTPAGDRENIGDILNSYVKIRGREILIKDVVDYNFTESYNEIWHENQTRTVFLYANIKNISLDKAVTSLKKAENEIPKISGQVITIGGANEEIRTSFSKLYISLLISIFLMYMVLAMEFESFLFPFIIILSVPMGLIGGILALFIFGQSINVISLIGLIILIGIANNDAVVKVEFIMRKRAEGLALREAIIQAGKDRFRPIVMTSLTTIFALIPMIIGLGAGVQLRKSLSIAIAGGLVTSTLLTLIIIPVFYSYMERWSMKKFNNSSSISQKIEHG